MLKKNFSRASISEEFNSLNPDDSLPTRRMYEQIPRENSDYRQQVENTSYHEDYRESVWQHRGHNIPEESHQEYNHSIPAYPSYLSSDLNHNKGKADYFYGYNMPVFTCPYFTLKNVVNAQYFFRYFR